jgi:TolA-binding protein
MAARLFTPPATSRAATTTAGWQAAQAVWARILTSYPRSPDAPDALLASARAAAASGDRTAAIAHYERLLIDYPTSALLPQGRRELERLKGTIP